MSSRVTLRPTRIPQSASLPLALAALLCLATLATGCGSASEDARPPSGRIAIIVLENHDYGEVIGNPRAPFLNGLAREGALAVNYRGVAHPSLPNYLALIGGSAFGIEEDCTECSIEGPNLATQMSAANLSWRAYMEGMPATCFPGSESGRYVKRHNPFMYFAAIANDRDLCENVVPASSLAEDLAQNALPTLAWIGPDLCHDAHDCDLAVADRWLSDLVPDVIGALRRDGLIAITFDESEDEPRHGRVATILAGPAVKEGARLREALDHYSLLATFEDRLGLPRLRHARASGTLRAALR